MHDPIQVGTVEILRMRVYNLDPYSRDDNATSVMVYPGTFPVYRLSGGAHLWMMTGQLNNRLERMGDGMFGLHNGDVPSGIEVTFPSRTFGPDEWRDMLAHPQATEGDPQQRLRFEMNEVPA